MNKILAFLLILSGCSQHEKEDIKEKAIDVPTKKIVFNRIRKYNLSEKPAESIELYLVKIAKENEVLLEYTDSLGSSYSYHSLKVFTDKRDYILIGIDSCTFVEQLEVISTEDTTNIFLYNYDLASVIDEECLIALDEEKELLAIYNYPWGLVLQFDSREKSKEHFDKIIDKVSDYTWQQLYKRKK